MKNNFFPNVCFFFFVFFLLCFQSFGTYYTRINNGNWNTAATWSTAGCGGAAAGSTPGPSDDVVICNGFTVLGDVTTTCNSLSIQGSGSLSFSGVVTITVTNALTLDGTSSVTGAPNAAKILTVGSLNVLSTSTASVINGITFTVNGTSTINGALDLSANSTGTKTFSGNVSLSNSGNFTSTGAPSTTFGASISNDGIFNLNTLCTLTGSGSTISGTNPVQFGQNLTINGTYTNNGTLTLSAIRDLLGIGSLTQGINSSLTVGRHCLISTIDATANSNTVIYNYTAAGANIKATTYYHLTISGASGTFNFTGNTNVMGNFTINSSSTVYAGGPYTHTISGSTNISGGGTLEIDNSGEIINMQDLTVNSGTIEGLASAFGTVTVATTLSVPNGGNFYLGGGVFNVSGTSNIIGTLTFNSGSPNGVKTFSGLVSIASTGTWNSNVTMNDANLIFQNGITNDGSFTAYTTTFNTNSQPLSTSNGSTMTFSNKVTISGAITVTNNAIVSMTNVAAGTLTGSGAGTSFWTQGATGTLNYSGASITGVTLTASAAGNTVNYNRSSGSQSLLAATTTYHHLIFSGASGTKTFFASTTINGDLTVTGSSCTGNFNANNLIITVTGATTIANGGIVNFNQGGSPASTLTTATLVLNNGTINNSGGNTALPLFDVTGNCSVTAGTTNSLDRAGFRVTGTTTVNGIFNISNNIISTVRFAGQLSVPLGGTFTVTSGYTFASGNGTLNLRGGVDVSGTFSATRVLFSNNNQAISGTGSISFSDTLKVTGIIVTNNHSNVSITSTGAGVLNGTGTWSQGGNPTPGTLNYSGSTITVTNFSASNTGNTVNYNAAGPQTIFNPNSGTASTYYNLSCTSSGNKTLGFGATVNGNILIDNTAVFAAGTNNISVGGNWTNNSSFTYTAPRTVTFNGSSTQSLGGTTATGFDNLTISNTAGINVTNNITVNNVLALNNGIVSVSSGKVVTIANTSTAAITTSGAFGTSIHVDGALKWNTANTAEYLFPTGDGGRYMKTGILPTTAAAADFTVEAFNSSPLNRSNLEVGIDHVSLVEEWEITGSASSKIKLYWQNNSGVDESVLSDLRVVHYTGGLWSSKGNSATDGAADFITSVASASYSRHTFASINTNHPLPVELISFDAVQNETAVDLKWETATEINNDYFILEKSGDGINFSLLDSMDGAGNSSSLLDYYYSDKNPMPGISYYRLNQVDNSGIKNNLKTISVNFEGLEIISTYPNPAENEVKFLINTSQDTYATYSIYDMKGQISRSERLLFQKGVTNLLVDITNLAQSFYVFRIVSDDNKYFSRKHFVKTAKN